MLTPGRNRLRPRATPARRVRLPGGERVNMRPIRADDAAAFACAYTRLSEQSRHRRFLSLATTLQPDDLRYLTAVDHHDHEALVAIDPETGDILGSARYLRHPSRPSEAELAIEVVDAWQRRGIGRALLQALSTLALATGVHRFTAIVAADNVPVQRALRHAAAAVHAADGELDYTLDVARLAQPCRDTPPARKRRIRRPRFPAPASHLLPA